MSPGSGFGVWDLWLRGEGLGLGIEGQAFRAQSLGILTHDLGISFGSTYLGLIVEILWIDLGITWELIGEA